MDSPPSTMKRPSALPHVLHVWPEREQDGTFAVMLSIHHALYDGSSLPQLLEDFEALIGSEEQKLTDRLPFYKLVPALLSRDKDVQHWTKALHGFQPTSLASSSSKSSGAAILIKKDLELASQDLESRSRKVGVSPQVLCNLAFGKLLALESGTRDVCFGQLFGLLDLLPEADTAVGPAFNTVATRVRFDELKASAKNVAAELQAANDAGRPHRRAALREVQAKLQQGQLFDALFDYQRAYEEPESGTLRAIELEDGGDEKAQYTLNVVFVQGPAKMSIVAKADSSRYDQKALSALIEKLEAVLQHLSSKSMILSPHCRMSLAVLLSHSTCRKVRTLLEPPPLLMATVRLLLSVRKAINSHRSSSKSLALARRSCTATRGCLCLV